MSTPARASDMPTAAAVKMGFSRSCQMVFDVGKAILEGPRDRRSVMSAMRVVGGWLFFCSYICIVLCFLGGFR